MWRCYLNSLTFDILQIPYLYTNEETLETLALHNVPPVRAVWYIRVLTLRPVTTAEGARNRKRPNIDFAADWTIALCRFSSLSCLLSANSFSSERTNAHQTSHK